MGDEERVNLSTNKNLLGAVSFDHLTAQEKQILVEANFPGALELVQAVGTVASREASQKLVSSYLVEVCPASAPVGNSSE